jgi:hypothetical protein
MKIPMGLLKLGAKLSANSPTLLIIAGVAFGAGAVVLSIKATLEANELIKDIEEEEKIELTPVEIIKEVWPFYAPAIGCSLISVGCIFGANHIQVRRSAVLAGIASLSERRFNEYRKKVIERLGEPTDREIRREVLRDNVANVPRTKHSGELVNCWDPYSGRPFVARLSDLHKACARINTRIFTQMKVRLNEWYEEVDLPYTILGDASWDADDLPLVLDTDTAIVIDDVPYVQVEFNVGPGERYLY